jgi:hypothetical protein
VPEPGDPQDSALFQICEIPLLCAASASAASFAALVLTHSAGRKKIQTFCTFFQST